MSSVVGAVAGSAAAVLVAAGLVIGLACPSTAARATTAVVCAVSRAADVVVDGHPGRQHLRQHVCVG